MAPRNQIIMPKLLLVEGADALYFFISALAAFGVDDVQVMDFGGITDLTAYLKALHMLPGYEKVTTIVIARDAETNPLTAVNNVRKSLQQAALPVPGNSFEFVGNTPRVAFMIFPGLAAQSDNQNNLLPGTLEDLCLEIVKDGSTFECVDMYIQCLQSKGQEITRLHKTKLHSYLSGNNDFVGLKIGEASKAGAWDWDHSRLNAFKDIIIQM
ncbi:DUF3226 domain-containing protein [Geobacter sp.]|uniref:DUF3226 domain-containing protein n=1 Tax=Geobacter sp. TaxID=46610 RepID=UPI0026310DEE|nr:DUF3226 domain-containing protein [Geobacter sp.]